MLSQINSNQKWFMYVHVHAGMYNIIVANYIVLLAGLFFRMLNAEWLWSLVIIGSGNWVNQVPIRVIVPGKLIHPVS